MNQKKEERIVAITSLVARKLELNKYLTNDEFLLFASKFTNFLRQNRVSSLLSMSESELEKCIEHFINFCDNVGFTKRESFKVLMNNFLLLDKVKNEDFLYKYIILSVCENKENTVRKDLLLNNSRAFNKDLEEFFARYMYIKSEPNIPFNKTHLICGAYNDFKDRVVPKTYVYKIKLNERPPQNLEDLIKKYPIDIDVINELRKNENNKNVSFRKRQDIKLKKSEKVKLAIENFSKVSNLTELSELLGISTSSLQRYLHDDAKEVTSKEIYKEIRAWLQNAKNIGLVKGGFESQRKHGYTKDDRGFFKGSGK